MKLKQVLAVMLSSVMVLSAAPTEVFAFDDLGVLTDSSGGTADEGSEQLENGNASVASSEADGIFDEGTAQEENADVAADGSAVQGDISDAASDGNAEQNDIADEISQDEELQQDTQGSDSLEKRKRMQLRLICFRTGRVQILQIRRLRRVLRPVELWLIISHGLCMKTVNWQFRAPVICLLIMEHLYHGIIIRGR